MQANRKRKQSQLEEREGYSDKLEHLSETDITTEVSQINE